MTIHRPFQTTPASPRAVNGQPLPSTPIVANGRQGSSGATRRVERQLRTPGTRQRLRGLTAAYPAQPNRRGCAAVSAPDVVRHTPTALGPQGGTS